MWPRLAALLALGAGALRPEGGRFLSLLQGPAEVCNASAAVVRPELRRWRLEEEQLERCRAEVGSGAPRGARNWCWVGLNHVCWRHSKDQISWSRLQDMASADGRSPSRSSRAFDPIAEPQLCDEPERGVAKGWSEQDWEAAQRWLHENVAVFVLTLPGIGDHRWATLSQRLRELHIAALPIFGVDLRVDGALEVAKAEGTILPEFNVTRAQEVKEKGSILGTVGCAAGHFKAQLRARMHGFPLALVLEDDAWPSADFVPRLWDLVRRELPCDWQVTALLSRCGYGRCVSPHLMRVMPDANEPAGTCHGGATNWGMHAMLYRVARTRELLRPWQQAAFNEESPTCLDVDVALASLSGSVAYYAVPASQKPGFLVERDEGSTRGEINGR